MEILILFLNSSGMKTGDNFHFFKGEQKKDKT